MGILSTKNILMILLIGLLFSCARLLPAEPQAGVQSTPQLTDDGDGQDPGQKLSLSGLFIQSDGATVQFKDFADQATIVFFAGEFCSACRAETERLVTLFNEKGLPTKIKILTVLVGSTHQEIQGWKETFEKGQPAWTLGADDEELTFYKKYFSKLVTPSILYVDPATQKIKKFQEAITIEELQKETQLWY
jgi:hypothetical protein